MTVELKLRRTTWHWVELEVSEEDFEMLKHGDLSPVWENDDARYTILTECPDDSEEEIEEMNILE